MNEINSKISLTFPFQKMTFLWETLFLKKGKEGIESKELKILELKQAGLAPKSSFGGKNLFLGKNRNTGHFWAKTFFRITGFKKRRFGSENKLLLKKF